MLSKHQVCKQVNHGLHTSVFKHPWTPSIPELNILSSMHNLGVDPTTLTMAQLDPVTGVSQNPSLQQLNFPLNVIAYINDISISVTKEPDKCIWIHSHSGIYTVKSGYLSIFKQIHNSPHLLNGYNKDRTALRSLKVLYHVYYYLDRE